MSFNDLRDHPIWQNANPVGCLDGGGAPLRGFVSLMVDERLVLAGGLWLSGDRVITVDEGDMASASA